MTKDGLDAGADTIIEHLHREQISISRTTVWRILKTEGQVTPQPQKRPRSSWQRFAADRPNEVRQSDFTHVTLSTGHDTKVIGWLDDHSRYLLHLTAHHRVTGKIVTDSFTTAAQTHGYPASTLTDNGMVYTTRYARGGANRGKNAFETLLALNGITQKNGKPFKPTTQGKIERFWQTLKRHLDTKPAASITDLQHTLDQFRDYYNTIRPHRRINQRTPTNARQPSLTRSSPRPHQPCPRIPTSGGSATTSSTQTARSPSAMQAESDTSASAADTPEPKSSASPTTTTQP